MCCGYCGKEIHENESVSIALNGENCADFCSVDCFRKNANRYLKTMKFRSKKEMEACARKLQKEYRTVQLNKLLAKETLNTEEAAALYQLLSAKDKHRLSLIGLGFLFARNGGRTQRIMEEIKEN